ncbi:hypothetical protein N7456_001730 [Penicillium angulare]|uniref:Glycine zipper 2TM domain-containing protein n=1 Tax=Penicillium angulare TaxID=116970 RepID=A0A9W9G6Z5_9EURO|nr:hypothetical protein N7456_001730 [Penicillium angulare]
MSNREYYGSDYQGDQSSQTNNHEQYGAMEGLNMYYGQLRPREGERGLGATVLGGTGGAVVGHHFGKKSDHGTLGTVGGALAGAVLANMAGNAIKGNHGHRGAGGRRRERLERRLDRLS